MFTEINREIYQLKEKLRAKEKLLSQKDMLEAELRRKTSKDELYKKLLKEKADVEKLDGLSFSAIFLSLVGRKEDRLDKERKSFLRLNFAMKNALKP